MATRGHQWQTVSSDEHDVHYQGQLLSEHEREGRHSDIAQNVGPNATIGHVDRPVTRLLQRRITGSLVDMVEERVMMLRCPSLLVAGVAAAVTGVGFQPGDADSRFVDDP